MLRSSVMALAMIASIAAVDPIRQALSPSAADFAKRGYTALYNGQRGDAVAAYTEAIRRHPDSYISYYRRGVTLAGMGDLEPALADLNAAVRLSPAVKSSNELGIRAWNSLAPETHALHLVVLVRAARAEILQQMKRPRDAIADLDVAIALDPRRTRLWHTRGLLHMEAGNAAAAVADFDALLARRENVEWRFARGVGHYVNGSYGEAEADFLKATTMDPKNALYARWLAKTQKRRGVAV